MRFFWLIVAGVLLAAAIPTAVVGATALTSGSALQPLLIASAVSLLIGLVLALSVARKLSGPLGRFDEAATSIARGKFGVQVDVTGKNELGALANTFNYMSAQIEAYGYETQRLYENVESGYLETIVALANSIDSKDSYTRGHSQRVADLAVEIGRELKMTEHELKQVRYGGVLHDIGKIGIVETILFKPARLTDVEMVAMREHPMIGDAIIQPVSFLKEIRGAVRNHHERWDGTGYPDRLVGDQIPLVARIVSAADTWDACTSTRPYQRGKSHQEVLGIIANLRGTQLDPAVADALVRVVEKRKTAAAESVKLAG